MSEKMRELLELIEIDPSEALYRAEAELDFSEFIDFVEMVSIPVTE